MGDSVMFLTGFSFVHTHASNRFWFSFSPFSLGQPFTVPGCTLRASWTAQLRVSLPPRVLMNVFALNMWNPMMALTSHETDWRHL